MPSRLAILTAAEPGPLAALAQQERVLDAALAERQIEVERLRWDARQDWSRFTAVLVRESWDYIFRLDDFLETVDQMAAVTRVLNPAPTIRWNTDKRYLLDLADQGVRVVPSQLEERLERRALEKALRGGAVVIKPTVGASALHTFLLRPGATLTAAMKVLGGEPVLIQPYLESIATYGETSLIYFGGRFSHAMRKRPAANDFRVQEELGGQSVPVPATEAELALASNVLEASSVSIAGQPPAYARIDLVQWEGAPALMEAELIEPVLYLSHAGAAAAFADEIVRQLGED